jgi:hypothetical protein
MSVMAGDLRKSSRAPDGAMSLANWLDIMNTTPPGAIPIMVHRVFSKFPRNHVVDSYPL